MARIRTFIAVELPRAIRTQCTALQDALSQNSGEVKWVAEESLHVTLLFLGEVDDRDLNNVCKAVAAACAKHAVFTLTISGVGTFGPKNQPRTIWAGVQDGSEELIALHADLEESLLRLGCYRREERKFTPHMTLGRVKSNRPLDGLAEAIEEHAEWHGGECEVTQIHVMSSQLAAAGPTYAVLSRAKLKT